MALDRQGELDVHVKLNRLGWVITAVCVVVILLISFTLMVA